MKITKNKKALILLALAEFTESKLCINKEGAADLIDELISFDTWIHDVSPENPVLCKTINPNFKTAYHVVIGYSENRKYPFECIDGEHRYNLEPVTLDEVLSMIVR